MRVHELHAPVKVVQRSKGRSAVAAAAYRAAERIEDPRTGLVHDYTKKQGVQETALLLPGNAPGYAHDRAALWQGAERQEKHPRAQTARDLTVGFPSEFGPAQRKEAGLRVGHWLVARYGVAVDIAWHEPSAKGDQRNHHAHLLFTTRRWDENGEWAKTKDRTLDDLQKGPEEVRAIRLGVADVLNNIAARDRLEVYVEHLSYERRGIDQEATQHMGPMATKMEREGKATDIGEKNRGIQARNEQRRNLREESKVVDIEIAREKLKARQQQEPQPKHGAGAAQFPAPDLYTAFYRETQNRRASLLQALEEQHRENEKRLQQEAARLTASLENAGFFSKLWREVTGRARAEREGLAKAKRTLEEIQRQRQTAHESFERERQQRLDALKAEQTRLEQERMEAAQEIPQAVNAPVRTTGPPAPSGPVRDQDAERRAFFQRMGARQKAERERKPAEEFTETVSPAPANDQPPAPLQDDEREAFMRRVDRGRNPRRESDEPGPKR